MKTIYKVFLVLFVVFLGVNLYVIDWKLGVFHEDNTTLLISLVSSILGLLAVFVLHTWSKLGIKN
ncbi:MULTISPECIES: hypothetical protein [Amniculibacterium]|uniref:hypothetical protein n=1 Tax=Amniculibacterium TaxID=2715289 RepID=UPI000F59F9AF|nr:MULTISPECIES: hypothetical protein [Amniculibacterium]